MGKVSTYLIAIGSVVLLPAILLSIISIGPHGFIQSNSLIIDILKAVALVVLYVSGWALVGLGLLIMKRDRE